MCFLWMLARCANALDAVSPRLLAVLRRSAEGASTPEPLRLEAISFLAKHAA